MTDTKNAQQVYEPSPVLRQATLDANPSIPALLAPAFAALDGNTLRTLNGKIAVDGQDVNTVASAWLKNKGLLK